MLNISHTKSTLVGDEFIRGVGGYQRKRVSIAETMTTRARVQSWDNSTRGLDVSTPLDFVKGLTDVLGRITFVSLHQPGEGIYDPLDQLMVHDHGRQVHFGPPPEARACFEELGFEFLPKGSNRFRPFPDFVSAKNSGFSVDRTFPEYVVHIYPVSHVALVP